MRKKGLPSLAGLTTEDAEWNLDIYLDQLSYIYAMNQWPLIDGPATVERLDQMISMLINQMETSKVTATFGGRLVVRRNPAAPECVELSLDLGHLDFSKAIEARDAK